MFRRFRSGGVAPVPNYGSRFIMSRFEILIGFQRFGNRLNWFRRWTSRGVQLAIFLFAGISAFLLRFDFAIPKVEHAHLWVGLCVWVIAKILVFQLFRLDRGWWRYVSVPDLLRVAYANLAGSALGGAGILLFAPPGVPRSISFVDFLGCSLNTAGVRLAVRIVSEFSRIVPRSEEKRTLIYGAGDAGTSLLREIRQKPAMAYDVAGFIDDDPVKTGATIYRTKVLGTGEALPSLVKVYGIDMVLIALPSATGREMTAILKHCQEADVAYKTVPSFAEILETGSLASGIRDVNVEDLLGRNPVYLDESGIRGEIENKGGR